MIENNLDRKLKDGVKEVMRSRFIGMSRSGLSRALDDGTMLANKPEREQY